MGPLQGLRVVEMGGLGPCPLCGMLLADLGADVIRIDRKTSGAALPHRRGFRYEVSRRGHSSVALDLKKPEGCDAVLRLIDGADVLIEGFRPGAMERLGLGPDIALARNPRLVYGRVTGWGQNGPLAQAAGHDINYIALTGALHAIGPKHHKPVVPLSLVGDFGGGTMLLAVGVLSALFEARQSGNGQVVDAAMIDGAALLMTEFYAMHASGFWADERGENLMGGSHYYDTYETKDGKFVAIGSAEAQFYSVLRNKLALTDSAFDAQNDRARWPELKEKLAGIFKSKTRAEWCDLLEGSDACFAPVLSMSEAPNHPHNVARETYIEIDGVMQPAPAPRFSRTQPERPLPIREPGTEADRTLASWGFSETAIAELKRADVLADIQKD